MNWVYSLAPINPIQKKLDLQVSVRKSFEIPQEYRRLIESFHFIENVIAWWNRIWNFFAFFICFRFFFSCLSIGNMNHGNNKPQHSRSVNSHYWNSTLPHYRQFLQLMIFSPLFICTFIKFIFFFTVLKHSFNISIASLNLFCPKKLNVINWV